MIKLSRDKQNKIIGVAAGTLVLAAALWYFVISAQNKSLEDYQNSIRDLQDKISKAEMRIRRRTTVQAELTELKQQVAHAEGQMIPAEQLNGKRWLMTQLNQFIGSKYDVTLADMHNTPLIERVLRLPKFAYAGASYGVEFRASYYEFGKFLADFENSFPYISVQHLKIWPLRTPSEAGGQTTDKLEDLAEAELEHLRISMKIVLLFKPAGAP